MGWAKCSAVSLLSMAIKHCKTKHCTAGRTLRGSCGPLKARAAMSHTMAAHLSAAMSPPQSAELHLPRSHCMPCLRLLPCSQAVPQVSCSASHNCMSMGSFGFVQSLYQAASLTDQVKQINTHDSDQGYQIILSVFDSMVDTRLSCNDIAN